MNKVVRGLLSVMFLIASTGLVMADGGKFVASKGSDKFHTADCPIGKNIKAENKVSFDTAQDAVKAGYKPCQKCDPLAGEGFVASKNSDKYHVATCAMAKKITADNLVKFKSEEEAAKAGYKPCQLCLTSAKSSKAAASALANKTAKK